MKTPVLAYTKYNYEQIKQLALDLNTSITSQKTRNA
jgi:hypothetical protein